MKAKQKACVNKREAGVRVRMQEAEAAKMDKFNYPGSTTQSNEQYTRGAKRRSGRSGGDELEMQRKLSGWR